MNRQNLNALRGEVHRFTGVVDRFGSFATAQRTMQTICIRELRLADSGIAIEPDHWWFRLREIWTHAGVQVGDRVLFTAKVQRCSKGWDELNGQPHEGRSRHQVVGFATTPRDVVVLDHPIPGDLIAQDLRRQLEHIRQQLADQTQTCDRLTDQRRFLLRQSEVLSQRLQETEQTRQDLEQRLQRQRHWQRRVLPVGLALAVGFLGGLGLSRQANPPAAASPSTSIHLTAD